MNLILSQDQALAAKDLIDARLVVLRKEIATRTAPGYAGGSPLSLNGYRWEEQHLSGASEALKDCLARHAAARKGTGKEAPAP